MKYWDPGVTVPTLYLQYERRRRLPSTIVMKTFIVHVFKIWNLIWHPPPYSHIQRHTYNSTTIYNEGFFRILLSGLDLFIYTGYNNGRIDRFWNEYELWKINFYWVQVVYSQFEWNSSACVNVIGHSL